MSLADELRVDQDPRVGRCKLCAMLVKLPEAEKREWAAAFADRAFTTSSLIRAVQRRDNAIGKAVVESHRKRQHRP